MIREGEEILGQAVERGRPGPYQIKAAIADCHMSGPKPGWQQISLLCGSFLAHEPTPVVALNWAVVMAELGETELALRKIEGLKTDLRDFQRFYAAYAKVLEQTGRLDEARATYQNAIDLAQNPSGQKFLENRLQQLES